jgi:hypothetical protein
VAAPQVDLVPKRRLVTGSLLIRRLGYVALVMSGTLATGCGNADAAGQTQKAIMKLMAQTFPSREWGVACDNGSEHSVTCAVIFSASVHEPLAGLQTQADAAGQDIHAAQVAGRFPEGFTSTPTVAPGDLSDGGLVPLGLQCSIPTTNPEHPDLGYPDYNGTFMVRAAKYDCRVINGSPADGIYPVGGGFTMPG